MSENNEDTDSDIAKLKASLGRLGSSRIDDTDLQVRADALQHEMFRDDSKTTINRQESDTQTLRRLGGETQTNRIERNLDGVLSSFEHTQELLTPDNSYATLLTRLAIFPATKRKEQKQFMDADNALVIESPFGSIRRFGAFVDPEDEDVLIALTRLRQAALTGPQHALPIPSNIKYENHYGGQQHRVHFALTTLGAISKELGLTSGGSGYKSILENLKRLNSIVVEIEVKKKDRYFLLLILNL